MGDGMRCWHAWVMPGRAHWQLRINRPGRRRRQLLLVRRDGRFEVVFDLNLGRLRASGFDQIGDINPPGGYRTAVKPSSSPLPGPAGHSKNDSNLRKYTDG